MINKEFFNRNPDIVAKELLGKIIVRKVDGKKLIAKIVETEAYFDEKDPASRARQNGDLRKTMEMDAGTLLVYGVHSNWLLNFITNNIGIASAVLIRAIEPLNFDERGDGPGLLTKSLKVGKELHKKHIEDNELWIENDSNNKFEIVKSFRIGVSNDLEEPMRFYIKDNKHISRK